MCIVFFCCGSLHVKQPSLRVISNRPISAYEVQLPFVYILCVIDIVLFAITVDPHYAMILVRRLRSRVSLSLGFTLFDRGAL